MRPQGHFNKILFEIQVFSIKKMQFEMSSAKWRPFCLGLNVLRYVLSVHNYIMSLRPDQPPSMAMSHNSCLVIKGIQQHKQGCNLIIFNKSINKHRVKLHEMVYMASHQNDLKRRVLITLHAKMCFFYLYLLIYLNKCQHDNFFLTF